MLGACSPFHKLYSDLPEEVVELEPHNFKQSCKLLQRAIYLFFREFIFLIINYHLYPFNFFSLYVNIFFFLSF